MPSIENLLNKISRKQMKTQIPQEDGEREILEYALDFLNSNRREPTAIDLPPFKENEDPNNE